jgi:hypothetical protein
VLAPLASSSATRPGLDFVARPGDLAVLVAILGWVTAVLLLDAGVDRAGQAVLGVLTWLVLIVALRREPVLVRVQVAVVVVFATLVEYTFSAWLQVYEYRLDGLFGVPTFVTPGHGLVYLAALLIGRSAFVRTRLRWCVAATLAAGTAYAVWGLTVSDRPDALGAFWFGCLVFFLVVGRRRGLYVGAFVVVTYLEVIGTALGVWTWQAEDPTGLVTIGNPPSGAAGGYGWFDLAAVALAPLLLGAWRRQQTRRRLRRPPAAMLRYPSVIQARNQAREDLVVEETVGGDGAASGDRSSAVH